MAKVSKVVQNKIADEIYEMQKQLARIVWGMDNMNDPDVQKASKALDKAFEQMCKAQKIIENI